MGPTGLQLARAFTLLATDPTTGRPVRHGGVHAGTVAALTYELREQGGVRLVDGRLEPTANAPTDPATRAVWDELRAARRPPRPDTWVVRRSTRAGAALRAHLLGELLLAGVVASQPGRGRGTVHPDVDPRPRAALAERAQGALAGGEDPWAAALVRLLVSAAGPRPIAAARADRREVRRQVARWRRDRYPDELVSALAAGVQQSQSVGPVGG